MLITLLLLVMSVGVIQEKPAERRPPKKGDTVVVRGCLVGGVIEGGELSSADGDFKVLEPHDYRLTGKKDLVKTLKEQHAGHADVITGVLKTDLPTERQGMRIGNAGVGMGAGNSQGYAQRALPVLEATSFAHVDVRCR